MCMKVLIFCLNCSLVADGGKTSGLWTVAMENALILNYVVVNIKVTNITKVTQILDPFNFIYLDIWVQNYGTGSPANNVGY